MNPLEKSELFLQLYGEYYNYHQQLGDDNELSALSFLICKNIGQVLQAEGIPFTVETFFPNHRTMRAVKSDCPFIVLDDQAWFLYGPVPKNVNGINVYSPSNFEAEFAQDFPDTVKEALYFEKQGLVYFPPFSLNQQTPTPSASLLSITDADGKVDAQLILKSSPLLESVVENPLSSMNAEVSSFDQHHYQWSSLDHIPVSLNPLTDFFYLHPESSLNADEFSEQFFNLDDSWQSANGNDSDLFKESLISIQNVKRLLKSSPNEHTVSLFFSPSLVSLVDAEFQSKAFQYHFEIKSAEDFQRMANFLIAVKNASFFGANSSLPRHAHLDLEELLPYSMIGTFVSNANMAHQLSAKKANDYTHIEPSLPLLGHFPALLNKIQYQQNIRPVTPTKAPNPLNRF